MTANPAKFTFDIDMSGPNGKSKSVSEERLTELLAEARAQGRQEGEQSALANAAKAEQQAVELLARQAGQLLGSVDAIKLQSTGDTARLGKSIAEKLAHHLVQNEPAAELEALLLDCLTSIDHAPHLVIRCHTDLADKMRETAEERISTSGFSGRLVVMGEPDIGLGDGRIEWADGGLVRDSEAVLEKIETSIQDYLKAKGVPEVKETQE